MPIRRFVVAVITGLLLCAARAPVRHSDSPSTQPPNVAPAADFNRFPGYSSDPCYKAEDQDVATFCAQWKAADAAKSSADATWWTVYLAGLGVTLGAVTMAAAIAAAYYAKKAADETKRGADAAHNANRPWLDVDLKLHGVSVNYDGKGYSLQVEATPLNAGMSPAVDVREHVQCLFYDHIPGDDDDPYPLKLDARDRCLRDCADAVVDKLREKRDAGPTVFSNRDQPIYIETSVPWDFSNGYPRPIAWLIVGLRYSFPEGVGETVKVFAVRSFGFPNNVGFESLGTSAFASLKANPILAVWPRHGYVK